MPRQNRNAGGRHFKGNSGNHRVHRGSGAGKRRRLIRVQAHSTATAVPQSRYAAKQGEAAT